MCKGNTFQLMFFCKCLLLSLRGISVFFLLIVGSFSFAFSQGDRKVLVTGTILDKNGAVISNVRISATSRDGKIVRATADETGVYELRLPTGIYKIRFVSTFNLFEIVEYQVPDVSKMRLDVSLICEKDCVWINDLVPPSPIETSRKNSTGPIKHNCEGPGYRQKTETELAKLTPRQLIDELVKVDVDHDSFDSYEALANYQILIDRLVRKSGVAALAPLAEDVNAYSPEKEKADGCAESRLSSALRLSNDIDRFEFRLRATNDGRLVIDAVEKAIERMKTADDKRVLSLVKDYTNSRLNPMRGINETDRTIQDTFWMVFKIEILDSELLEFSNYLVTKDHTYPAWSKTDFVEDISRKNEAGGPRQVYVMKDEKRFYDAYLEFKKTKKIV